MCIPFYKVPSSDQYQVLLTTATQIDAKLASRLYKFDFNWEHLWDSTDFRYQAIVKIMCNGELQGLSRIALYEELRFLEILNIETFQNQRLFNPVGIWLIWYCTKIATLYSYNPPLDSEDRLIYLESFESAIDYYRERIGMIGLGWTQWSAPGEDYYAFEFRVSQAFDFLRRTESRYGVPQEIKFGQISI